MRRDQMQLAEEVYRSLFEKNPIPMWVHDAETLRFLAVNQSAIEKYGFSKEEFLAMTLNEIHCPENVGATSWHGTPKQFTRLRARDGTIINVECKSSDIEFKGRSACFMIVNDVTDIVTTEALLRKSEERFHQLIETTSAMMYFYRGDRFSYVNSASEAITGYTKDELMNIHIWDLIHPDHREMEFQRSLARQRGEDVPARYELKLIHKSGAIRWVDLAASAIQIGGEQALMGTAVDITERKRVEEELQRSEGLTHRILEAVPGGIIEVSLDGRILQANLEAQHFYGLPALEFSQATVGTLASNSMSEDGTELRVEDFPLARCLRTGEDCPPMTFGVRRPDGGISWGVFTAVPLLDISTGQTNGAVLTFLDITGRKRTEDALRESEERYRKFFEEDLTGDYIASIDGYILACNQAFATIFGFESVDAAMYSNLNSLYGEPSGFTAITELLEEQKRIDYHEGVAKRRDGKPVYIIENLIGLFDESSKLIGVKGYVFNNTAHKLLEQQVQEAAKIEGLGRLAGGIAHDFNNLLSIILGYSERLQNSKERSVLNDARAITTAAQRGANLVRQLLTFARKAEVTFEYTNINTIVEELGNLLTETFPRNIAIEIDLDPLAQPIIGDANQIHQAALNLCVNARDAMPGGGTLTLKTEAVAGEDLRGKFPDATDAYVGITVGDTGFGMSEEIREKIFEPFFTTKESARGTGLGLAVVYGIVNAHRGIIDVISESGKGATFKLYFPVSSTPGDAASKERLASAEPPGGTETILLAEDEEQLRELVQSLLERKGYTILAARDGEEAVALFRQHHAKVDLALMDLGLPKLGGWEACRLMKEINPSLKIIVASGYLDPDAKHDMLNEGVQEFVQKPYFATELMAKVRETLDRVG